MKIDIGKIFGFAEGPQAIRKKVIISLNRLIEANNDRYREYKKAMDEIEDVDLKPVFRRYYQQSLEFKTSLATWIKAYGGDVSHDLYNRKILQQIWVDIKSVFPVNEREAILNACEYTEVMVVDEYKKILSLPYLPAEAYSEIQRQMDQIVSAHREIISLLTVNALFI